MIGLILLLGFGAVSGAFLYSAWAGVSWTYRGITVGGSTGGIGSYLVAGYTNMYVWLEKGWNLESWGGLLLLIGMLAFSFVLVANLILTKGHTAVR